MKKLLTMFVAMMLLSGPMGGLGNASSFLNNWYLDPDQAGAIEAQEISEALDIAGGNYVFTTLNEDSLFGDSFDFWNFGFFSSSQYDNGQSYDWVGDIEFTGIFWAKGTGILGGGISFNDGMLDIYSDDANNYGDPTSGSQNIFFGANDGTQIAEFSLLSGSGLVKPTGVPNGSITLTFGAPSLLEGTWFDSNQLDLSSLMMEFVFGYSTSNGSYTANPDPDLWNELLAYGDFLNVDLPNVPVNVPPNAFVLGSNGQFRLAVVPEPSTALLLGAGLLGLGYLGRRKSVA